MKLKILYAACFSSILIGQEIDDEFIKSLQSDLSQYTELATETKQNVDYMPYIVSVLNNKELQQLGVLSLREAIRLIPGVDVSIGMAGVKNPIFRGSNPFAMGQSKLIIDGVVVNDQMFGAYNQYLEMPIDIIQRIEVVRGPGSLLSDVNAYAGSIHVITKANRIDSTQKGNSVFAGYGSNDYGLGGFVGSYVGNELELNSDFFYQTHNQQLPTGPDRFGQILNSQQDLDNYALGISGSYKDFYLKGRLNSNDSGVSYGQSFSLSNDSSDHLDVQNNSLELGYKFDLGNNVNAKLSVGYFDETRDLQNKVMPNGSSMGPNTFVNGLYFLVDYSEKTYNQRLEFEVKKFENHKINAGIVLSQSYVKNNNAKQSMNNLQSFMNSGKILSTESRKHTSLFLEDLIDLNNQTSVQLGLKFDEYSDVSSQFSPRLALVHRYDDENIYKFMYTRSYREPSWREQYLNGAHYFSATLNMKPETVDAYEVSYIKKISNTTDIKLNGFYLANKDQINAQNAARTFKNSGDHELYGFEAEYKTSFTKKDNFYVNYSYVDGENVVDALASSAKNMIKAYYIYAYNKSLSLSTIVQYTGEKERVATDIRSNVDDYIKTDLTAVYNYEPYDIDVTLSVKNVFDEKYYLPAPENTYANDFEQEGRTFLFRLGKRF